MGLKVSDVSPVVLDEPRDATVGISVSLHPLPIISMSEHLTRTAMQTGSAQVKIVGALVGSQSGRDVEIHTTFEFLLKDGATIDHEFLRARQAQFKQVFPSFELLGWYSNGACPTQNDMDLHKQLLEYNESPLFLQLSPSSESMNRARSAGELPIGIYETFIELAQPGSDAVAGQPGGPLMYFKTAKYNIETGEAERIAVDHTSKPPVADDESGQNSSLIASLSTQYNATKMLLDRISTLSRYVEAVKSEQAPRDHESMRQIASLLAGLPSSGEIEEFEQEFMTEYNDLLLTNYLSDLTGNLNVLNELVDKFEYGQPNTEESFGGGAAGASRLKGVRGTGRAGRTGMV